MRTTSLIPVPISRILGPLMLAVTLCSCNLLIPENPSAPRYNSVMGSPRKPMLNPGGSGGDSSMAPRRISESQSASAFPPVDPSTEARAQEIMASDVPPPPQMAGNARQMPMENGQPGMQMAGNYPDLHSVPPTPPMGTPDSAEARLARVRAQLEAERTNADYDRARLATDAAAEPSLLNTPVPAPLAPAPAGMAPQSSLMTPNGSIGLPPPPPPLAQSAGTPWDRGAMSTMASAPMSTPAMEPIVLRPPVAQAAPAPNIAYANPGPIPSMSPSMSPAMAGGFNPMAGTEPITLRAPTSYAGGTSYLPNSRYSTRRN